MLTGCGHIVPAPSPAPEAFAACAAIAIPKPVPEDGKLELIRDAGSGRPELRK